MSPSFFPCSSLSVSLLNNYLLPYTSFVTQSTSVLIFNIQTFNVAAWVGIICLHFLLLFLPPFLITKAFICLFIGVGGSFLSPYSAYSLGKPAKKRLLALNSLQVARQPRIWKTAKSALLPKNWNEGCASTGILCPCTYGAR